MTTKKFTIDASFKRRCLHWATAFDHYAFFNYAEIEYSFGNFPSLFAVGAVQKLESKWEDGFFKLREMVDRNENWLVGFMGYDLKNDLENLTSENPDNLCFPDLFFFIPRHIFQFDNEGLLLTTDLDPDQIIHQIESTSIPSENIITDPLDIKQRTSRSTYLQTVGRIKSHLIKGDIYELNYCTEFYSENAKIDPLQVFLRLNELSPAPFSVFMKMSENYLISASPERFLKKENDRLISQPMKGTSRRSADPVEDESLKNKLSSSEKERSENMMIVDLVRNDLARSSQPGTVKVDELFGVYSFRHVHQMISTISAELKKDIHFLEAIKNAFPMGSMTGAPKIRAMELIEQFENRKRGLFSGAAGYITPQRDFDFNVVIRSILYSETENYLSFQTGSAITYDSDPEQEYEECLLKAEAMKKALR